jgi:hypothetical protein
MVSPLGRPKLSPTQMLSFANKYFQESAAPVKPEEVLPSLASATRSSPISGSVCLLSTTTA